MENDLLITMLCPIYALIIVCAIYTGAIEGE